MPTIHVDNESYEISEGQNLLAACLSQGLNLPYFCWHPAMGSVGACRQCAVKVFKDERDHTGRLVMACMTDASDGIRASIDDAEAKAFRASIIEWLMTNHPHDCPVCDEGGECHLQDMTVMTGHAYRRYRFQKRTYVNQYLGPFIHHEMNRCIECYRCVRFYRDHAGGRDFNVFASRNHVYFGRSSPGVLENEFSGNLVEVCPTGVFTDRTLFHHYSRKWDLQNAPSLCVHCGIGCNTTPGERYGLLRRIVNRYNSRVNGYFLCDRGRFGYEFVNSPTRIKTPLMRRTGQQPLESIDRAAALEAVRARFAEGQVIGIGSPRASLEANFALRRLVGPESFFQGIPEQEVRLHEELLRLFCDGSVAPASIQDIEQSDAVLVLGEDTLNRAPRLALAILQASARQPAEAAHRLGIPLWNDAAVRQATDGKRGPLYLVGHRKTWLDEYAVEAWYAPPDEVARLGLAIAHILDKTAPSVPDLSEEVGRMAEWIADALSQAKQPAIVSGTGSLSDAVLRAAAQIAWALKRKEKPVKLALTVSDCNSMGTALLGGRSLDAAMALIRADQAKTVIVLENDLSGRLADPPDRLPNHLTWIVLDQLENVCTAKADIVLPAATFAEGDGTLVNYEGRAQRHYQVFIPTGDIIESWRWFKEIAASLDGAGGAAHKDMAAWGDLDDVVRDVGRELPLFQPIVDGFPSAELRIVGRKIPRQPERYSGRTAMSADRTMHEPTPPPDPDSPFAFTMEGPHLIVPAPLRPQTWAPGWNSNQALNKFQEEVGGPLKDERPGPLLIHPDERTKTGEYDVRIPTAFRSRPHEWLALPRYEIFGSDELSRAAEALATRIPTASLVMHPNDTHALAAKPGDWLTVLFTDHQLRLPLVIDDSVPEGTVGIPRISGTMSLPLPAWCRITKDGSP